MMFPRSQPLAILLLAVIVTFSTGNTAGANSSELLNSQQKFAASLKPLLESYHKELSTLEKSLEGQSNPRDLNEVRNEIKRVESQLEGITTLINYEGVTETKAPPKKVDASKPKPTIQHEANAPYKPQTHIINTQGIAGVPKFSRNNVYTFILPNTGESSHLKFYATGRRSTDTEGVVWLIKPNGEKLRIVKWKENDFKYSSEEVQTYSKLEPITADITDGVNGPGTYQIEFQWTGGIDPLVIYRVELTS